MKIDGKLIEHLYKKYAYKDGRGVRTSWDDVLKEYQEIKGLDEPLKMEAARNYVKGKTDRLWEEKIEADNKEALPGNQYEYLEDGRVRLIAYAAMTREQAKDPHHVLKINGYNPESWIVIKLTLNEWTARNADNKELYNYQIKLEMRQKLQDEFTLEDLKEVIKEYTYVHHQGNYIPRFTRKGMVLDIADLHIGSNGFYQDFYKEKILESREQAKLFKVEKVYINFLGDIIHVNDSNKQTNKGTQLETIMTVPEMFRLAKEIIDYTLYTFSDYELEIRWVPGNHSIDLEYALFYSAELSWRNNEHMKFDMDESPFKALLYGSTLIGLHHGNIPKTQLFDWLARDFSEMWGKSKFREQHTAHLHHEVVKAKAGITHRTVTTPVETNEYERSLGFKNIQQKIQSFIYDYDEGLKHVNYH